MMLGPRLFADNTIEALRETAFAESRPVQQYIQALVVALDELELENHNRIPMAD